MKSEWPPLTPGRRLAERVEQLKGMALPEVEVNVDVSRRFFGQMDKLVGMAGITHEQMRLVAVHRRIFPELAEEVLGLGSLNCRVDTNLASPEDTQRRFAYLKFIEMLKSHGLVRPIGMQGYRLDRSGKIATRETPEDEEKWFKVSAELRPEWRDFKIKGLSIPELARLHEKARVYLHTIILKTAKDMAGLGKSKSEIVKALTLLLVEHTYQNLSLQAVTNKVPEAYGTSMQVTNQRTVDALIPYLITLIEQVAGNDIGFKMGLIHSVAWNMNPKNDATYRDPSLGLVCTKLEEILQNELNLPRSLQEMLGDIVPAEMRAIAENIHIAGGVDLEKCEVRNFDMYVALLKKLLDSGLVPQNGVVLDPQRSRRLGFVSQQHVLFQTYHFDLPNQSPVAMVETGSKANSGEVCLLRFEDGVWQLLGKVAVTRVPQASWPPTVEYKPNPDYVGTLPKEHNVARLATGVDLEPVTGPHAILTGYDRGAVIMSTHFRGPIEYHPYDSTRRHPGTDYKVGMPYVVNVPVVRIETTN